MNSLATNLPGELRMLDVLRNGLRTSRRMSMSVSFLRFSGLQLIVDELKAFVAAGGHARILTSTYLGVTQPEALAVLAGLEGVDVRLQIAQQRGAQGFHPKFVVFEGGDLECWVGSSNLSKGGLATNVEANLRQVSREVVEEVRRTFERLWDDEFTQPITERLRDAYARALLDAAHTRMPAPALRIDVPTVAGPRGEPVPNVAQTEALSSLARLRERGERRAVVIAAPGVGKTFLAAFDALAAGARSVLFVSHRLEHLEQAERTFARVFGERRETGMVYSGRKEPFADLVFTTVQSAVGSVPLLERAFDYLVIDEFHHAAAPSYQRLLERIEPGFLLGLTATPERQDGHDVIRICDFNVAYEVRLVEAINRDWLVPFHYFGIADETVDWDASFWRKRHFDPKKMENALMLEERVDHILEHALEKGYDGRRRATVGFCAGVRHAQFMTEQVRRRGFAAEHLTGVDDLGRRREIYDALEDPDDPLEWLFVADLLNEGVDIPGLNSLLFLRPTDSSTIFIQQLGRGLRLSPDCEVLTALDFVGHHRNAWLTIEALADRAAPPGPSTVPGLEITPPRHCEIVLDDLTRDILVKVREQSLTKRDECVEAYEKLLEEVGPPFPIDLIGRSDVPELGQFRYAFDSWRKLRVEMGDAESWERKLDEDALGARLLAAAELNWQQPRVYAYALLWGICHSPDDPTRGYQEFFERFPRWRPEHAELGTTSAWKSLRKKVGEEMIEGRALAPEVFEQIPRDELLGHVERRLRYTLELDYQQRHGGVLRTPDQLVLHRNYDRPEVINYFGQQYDPAVHNKGFLELEAPDGTPHIVLITKIDTSGAKREFQYDNALLDATTFRWQSQNRQRQNNAAGRKVTEHEERGEPIHIFAQPKSHRSPFYLGTATVAAVEGNGPMNVTFRLHERVPAEVGEVLGLPSSETPR